jgi:hypothetical protein
MGREQDPAVAEAVAPEGAWDGWVSGSGHSGDDDLSLTTMVAAAENDAAAEAAATDLAMLEQTSMHIATMGMIQTGFDNQARAQDLLDDFANDSDSADGIIGPA